MEISLSFSNLQVSWNTSYPLIANKQYCPTDDLEFIWDGEIVIFQNVNCVEDLIIESQYPIIFSQDVGIDNLSINSTQSVKFKESIYVDSLIVQGYLIQVAKLWEGNEAILKAQDIYLQEVKGNTLMVDCDLLLSTVAQQKNKK